jgi:hypothetical protein
MFLKQLIYSIVSMFLVWPIAASNSGESAIAATISRPENPPQTVPLIAQEAIVETVLFFETENFAVRIFRRGEALFMNLYNKQTGFTEVRETPAEQVPDTRNWITYRNSLGEVDRFAKLGLNGESQLEIVDPSTGRIIVQEAGYDTVVGVRDSEMDFAGNTFVPGTAATIIAPRYAELRQKPSPSADMLMTIPRGDVVDVLARVGNPEDGFIWYQVLYNSSTTGWIRGDALTPI